MADKQVNLFIKLKDGVTKAMKGIKKSFANNMQAMQKSALIFAGGFAGVVTGVFKAVDAFKTQQRVTDQTNRVLESTGHAAGLTADEIAKMSAELQKTTGVSDEVTQSAQNILLTFTGLGKDVFPDVTKVVLDMTAAMNHGVITQENLKMQSIQVGKALNDPIKGLTALTRVGVSFTEQQKEQIKQMQLAGDVAGAQAIMLAELQKEFGGSAENLNTLVGAQRAAEAAVGDMMEVIGEAFLPVMQKLAIVTKNAANAMQEWLPKVKDLIAPVAIFVGGLTGLMAVGGAVVTLGPMVGAAFTAMLGPIGLAITAITGIVAALVYFKTSNSNLAQTVRSVWNTIGTTVEAYGGAVWETIKNLGNIFKDFGSIMKSVVTGDFKGAMTAFQNMSESADNSGQAFVDASNLVKQTFADNLAAEKAAIAESIKAKKDEIEIKKEMKVADKEEDLVVDQEFLDRKAEMEQIAEDARVEFEEQKKIYDQMSAAERLKLLTDTLGKEKILKTTEQINELIANGKHEEAKKKQNELYHDAFIKLNEKTIDKLDDSYKKHWSFLITGAKLNAKQREDVDAVMAQTFRDILTLMGNDSVAAFRVMQGVAIAETIINTIKSAQAAFAAMAGIPPAPVWGIAAASIASAAGAVRVEQIRRQRPPQAATGAFAPGDGATVNIGEKGNPEWVLNEGNMRALLNEAGGGKGQVINLSMDGEIMQQWVIKSEEQKELMQKEGRL